MLGHSLRRMPNIKTILGQRIVYAAKANCKWTLLSPSHGRNIHVADRGRWPNIGLMLVPMLAGHGRQW